MPAGYAADVPIPSITRAATSQPSDGAHGASAAAASTIASPTRKTRFAPKPSASRPIIGWPTAVAR
ncbi:hypothetical protein X984_4132 [Burkholderia pseudomallei]|nr:hypothetical protein X984_4132 [Burkholderia pseudomallei]